MRLGSSGEGLRTLHRHSPPYASSHFDCLPPPRAASRHHRCLPPFRAPGARDCRRRYLRNGHQLGPDVDPPCAWCVEGSEACIKNRASEACNRSMHQKHASEACIRSMHQTHASDACNRSMHQKHATVLWLFLHDGSLPPLASVAATPPVATSVGLPPVHRRALLPHGSLPCSHLGGCPLDAVEAAGSQAAEAQAAADA